MRFAFALITSLLFAAPAAWAAPPPSDQSIAPSQGERPQSGPGAKDATGHGRKDVGGAPTPDQPSPHQWRARFPGYGSGSKSDQAMRANCYTVFGELRCDRTR
ncbi:MAG TPA: hypothetical protein VIJ94_07495 [Caulobacteraceae bacterium]